MKPFSIKYIGLILISAFPVQCSDLSEDPFTSISPDNFYKDAADLNKALMGVYDRYQEHYGRDTRGYYLKIESLSEFGAPNRTEDSPHLYKVWSDVNNPAMTIDKWGDSYQIINAANLVIGKGRDIPMDKRLKQQRFGEARFLRALTYFTLLRLYGGMPIPETYTQDLDNLQIPRKTVEETYNYIIADLTYAADHLPLKSEYGNEEVWRVSKGAAQALLGKVFLYRGSMTGNVQYFEENKRYSKRVIDSEEYALEPDFRDLWKWWNPDNENGIESVFEIQLGHKDGEDNTLHTYAGINIADENVGAQMYHRYGPSFTAYNSYNDQDYRQSSTFLTKITLSTGNTIEWIESDKGFYPGNEGWQSATPGNLKYYDRTAEAHSTGYAGTNIYVLRYAEAENAINGPTGDAYSKINMVRNRAKLPDLTTGLTKEQFADSVYRERGWEFIGEGQLYYDGIRMGNITAAVKEEVAYGNENGLYLYSPLQFAPTKDFLWKIPRYDLNANPSLEQNPDNENAL